MRLTYIKTPWPGIYLLRRGDKSVGQLKVDTGINGPMAYEILDARVAGKTRVVTGETKSLDAIKAKCEEELA